MSIVLYEDTLLHYLNFQLLYSENDRALQRIVYIEMLQSSVLGWCKLSCISASEVERASKQHYDYDCN